ncbi:MAG: hypothetical protein F6K52_21845, partial [Moorea sp. SIO3H5]|nr:hypothetical protein [Moorena sp. SIO3H5]
MRYFRLGLMGGGSREEGAGNREQGTGNREQGENPALLNNGMILRVGALSNGRVNRPWVAPVEWASWWNGHQAWNWHLASFNVLMQSLMGETPAGRRCIAIFSSGQDAHS